MGFRPINPNGVPPGGWHYLQPETGYEYLSFSGTASQMISEIIAHRTANARFGLSVDPEVVQDEVFGQIASRLVPTVRDQYFNDLNGSAQKKTFQLRSAVAAFVDRVRQDVKGLELLTQWLGQGGLPVSEVEANRRADICIECPYNVKGHKTEAWVATQIKKLNDFRGQQLAATRESELHTCSVCGCYLPLKIWVPSKSIEEHTDVSKFPPHCWIKQIDDDESIYQRILNENWRGVAEQTPWETGHFGIPEFQGADNFNPGIVDWNGRKILFVRRHIGTASCVVAYDLNPDLTLGKRTEIVTKHHSVEDPRAWVYDGKLYMSACIYTPPTSCRQGVFLLDENLRVQSEIHIPVGRNGAQPWMSKGPEKNWVFFDADKLGFVYSTAKEQGHQVYLLNDQFTVSEKHATEGIEWEYGEIRGGTPPVKVGDEFISFFHSHFYHGGFYRYVMGAYAFTSEPPFKITRMTRHPILYGNAIDMPKGHDPVKQVVFPCGNTFDGKEWFVTYGINDMVCGWIRIPHVSLLERMK